MQFVSFIFQKEFSFRIHVTFAQGILSGEVDSFKYKVSPLGLVMGFVCINKGTPCGGWEKCHC